MNVAFSSLPAIALHHHFKTSHVNKCTALSCLRFSSISPAPLLQPDVPFLPPCLGKHREGWGGCSVGRRLVSFARTQVPSRRSPFHQHHGPTPQRELSVPKPHPSSFQNPESRRGQRGQEGWLLACVLATANTTLTLSLVSTSWPHMGCLGPLHAIKYPAAVRE